MRGNRPPCSRPTTIIASAAWRRCCGPPRMDDRAGAGMIGSRIALSAPAQLFDESVDLFAAIARGAEEAQARLHPGRRSAVPVRSATCSSCAKSPTRSASPCSATGCAPISRASCSPARAALLALAEIADRAEGGVRMRAQGDDEPARRRGRPRGRRRRADRDRRQRPLHRAMPQAFLRAAEREPSAPAEPRPRRAH